VLSFSVNRPDAVELAAPGDASPTLTAETVHMVSSGHDNHSSTAVSTVLGFWTPGLDGLLQPVTHRYAGNEAKAANS
jgi:hypothetical protein